MRLLPIAAAGLTVAVVGGAAGITAVGASRQSTFASRAASLEHRWTVDVGEGVPETSIQPLRQRLTTSGYQAPWWSPTWWTSTGAPLLDQLDSQTAAAWQSALATGRSAAQAALARWAQLEVSLGGYVPAAAGAAAAAWPAQLQTASTPSALAQLASQWSAAVDAATQQAQTAQHAAVLNAQVATYGGVTGVLKQAQAALQVAQADNLDPGQLASAVPQLQQQVQAGSVDSATLSAVTAALQTLRSLISLNNSVSGGLRPLLLAADQASAEGTPDAGSFQAQYRSAAASLQAARTAAQLTAVQQQTSGALSAVNAELSADRCGHAVGGGKVITINLTLQEAVFYQDGCELQAGPVTTGRPELRTPTGTFHVFYKQSPVHFVSPWPIGSPFYYVPSWTDWGMEFNGGGYFIHDAPWEADSALGPGSENSAGASHGCVHLTHALMQWAYQWTPIGTPVLITN